MDASILKTVGQVAGIGGISLGVLLLLFRDIIRKNIFPTLASEEAYRLLRLITVAVWSVALAGIGAWVYVSTAQSQHIATTGDNSPVIINRNGNVSVK